MPSKPTSDENGVSKWTADYDVASNQVEMAFWDSAGCSTRNKEGIAKWKAWYNDSGNLRQVLFFGPDGDHSRPRLGWGLGSVLMTNSVIGRNWATLISRVSPRGTRKRCRQGKRLSTNAAIRLSLCILILTTNQPRTKMGFIGGVMTTMTKVTASARVSLILKENLPAARVIRVDEWNTTTLATKAGRSFWMLSKNPRCTAMDTRNRVEKR